MSAAWAFWANRWTADDGRAWDYHGPGLPSILPAKVEEAVRAGAVVFDVAKGLEYRVQEDGSINIRERTDR